MASLKKLKAILENKNNYLILGHIDPDGDCIGSVFSLKWMLDKLNKKSHILLNKDPLNDYSFFFKNQEQHSEDYSLISNFVIDNLNWEYFNCIILDAGNQERAGKKGNEIIDQYVDFLINIDHHPDNPGYGDLSYIDAEKAAVGEIIYDLADILDINIDDRLGTSIATAILSDTGGLKYENTTSRILKIIADLMDKGIDLYNINRKIFGNYSFKSVKLKGFALGTLEKTEKGQIAWLYVDKEMKNKTNCDLDSLTDIVNYARDIKGVEVGLAFEEIQKNRTKVSLRSNEYVFVNEIAGELGGGGHPRAAGCKIDKPLKETINLVVNMVKKYLNK